MKFIILILFLSTLSLQGQTIEVIDSLKFEKSFVSKLSTSKSKEDGVNLAKQDIEGKSLFLIVPGGVAPTVNIKDFAFSQNYDVSFINFGCEDISTEIITAYNKTIFEALNEKFGMRWILEIRKDVIGLMVR